MEDKIIGLVRASSERQEIISQKEELERFIIDKGFKKENIVWVEGKASALKAQRDYRELLEEIKSLCKSGIRYVAIWHMNRLGRREDFLMSMKNFFLEEKVQLFCKEPNFQLLNEDWSENRGGTMIFNIFCEVIRSDNEERRAKFKRGKAYKKSKGKFLGGTVTFGYKVNSEQDFVIDPVDSEIVRKIYEKYLNEHKSGYTICKEINEIYKGPKGGKLYPGGIHRILNNRIYYGEEVNGRTYPAIISKELFDKVREKMHGNSSKVTKTREHISLASGVLVCSNCGRKYFDNGKKYICVTKASLRPITDCKESPMIDNELVDRIVRDLAVVLHTEWLYRGNENIVAEIKEQNREYELRIDYLQEEISEYKKKIKKIEEDFYIGGKLTENRFNELRGSIEVKKEKSESELEFVKNRIKINEEKVKSLTGKRIGYRLREISDSLQKLSMTDEKDREELRDMVRLHIRKIVVQKIEDNFKLFKIELEDNRKFEIKCKGFPGLKKDKPVAFILDKGEWKQFLYASMSIGEKRTFKSDFMILWQTLYHDLAYEYVRDMVGIAIENSEKYVEV